MFATHNIYIIESARERETKRNTRSRARVPICSEYIRERKKERENKRDSYNMYIIESARERETKRDIERERETKRESARERERERECARVFFNNGLPLLTGAHLAAASYHRGSGGAGGGGGVQDCAPWRKDHVRKKMRLSMLFCTSKIR